MTSLSFYVFIVALVGVDVATSSPACSSQIGTDYSGPNIDAFPAVNALICQLICRSDPRCKSYSFYGPRKGCYLKADAPTGKSFGNSQSVSGICGCDRYRYPAPQVQPGVCTSELGVDYWGNDISNFLEVSAYHCLQRCWNTNGCNAYSYNADRRRCYLKSAAKNRIQLGIDQTSGICQKEFSNPCLGKIGVSFRSKVLHETLSSIPSSAVCRNKCQETASCTAFEFVPKTGECSILKRAKNPSPEVGIISAACIDLPFREPTPCTCSVELGIRLAGGEAFYANTPDKCRDACQADKDCLAFSFEESSSRCRLSRENVGQRFVDDKSISGICN